MKKQSQKVLKYEAIFEEQKEGGYTATIPSLPGCISEGNTFEEAKKNITEAITAYLESLAMVGEEPPEEVKSIFIGQIEVNQPTVAQ